MKSPLLFTGKLLLFVGLSAADFAMTWFLISRGGGEVYEANPVAAWWLGRHGWFGLALFKASIVGIVASLLLTVWRNRPISGHRLATFACLIVAAVVGYSGVLATRRPDPKMAAIGSVSELQEWSERLQADLEASNAYRKVLYEISDDLAADRCNLAEAVDRLSQTEKGNEEEFRKMLRRLHPDLDERSSLAICVVQFTLRWNESEMEQLLPRLYRQLLEFEGADRVLQRGILREFTELDPAFRLPLPPIRRT